MKYVVGPLFPPYLFLLRCYTLYFVQWFSLPVQQSRRVAGKKDVSLPLYHSPPPFVLNTLYSSSLPPVLPLSSLAPLAFLPLTYPCLVLGARYLVCVSGSSYVCIGTHLVGRSGR
jgi:hypothetical protein